MLSRNMLCTMMAITLLGSASTVSAQDAGQDYVPVIPPVVVYDDIPEDYDDISLSEADPLESFNRTMHGFNDVLDDNILKPVARGYRYVMPKYGRERVSNVLTNLRTPVDFVNHLVQGEVRKAGDSFWRFIVNSTLGVGGLNDVASEFGIPKERNDFGITLARMGFSEGAYVVLPLLGPTTVRDGIGDVVDIFSSPVTYSTSGANIVHRSTNLVSSREALLDLTDELERNAFDPYVSIRSSYLQNRQKNIEEATE